MPNAVETRELTRAFDGTVAVDAISFSVERGEVFGLVGPDGAGKTTTLRMLAAILDPTSGSASVLGFDTKSDSDAIHDHTGYMSQRFGLYPDLTVAENIDFYADLYGVPRRGRSDRIDELLEFSNMGAFKQRRAGKLSGGMKQKLGLVCALIHSPEILFLDEPTNGVDPVSRRDFWRILNRLVKDEGVTVVVSTAYLDEAERCSRVALLHRGKMIACDTPENVKALLPGAVLEVRSNDSRAVARAIHSRKISESVVTFGTRVHVIARDPDTTRAAIEKALAEETIEHEEIAIVEPSLENVFVVMLQDRESGVSDDRDD